MCLLAGLSSSRLCLGSPRGPASLSPLGQSMGKQEGGFHDSEKQNSSFLAQVDKLQKAFLKRPGCPQLSTRATSMAHCGERGVGVWGGIQGHVQ